MSEGVTPSPQGAPAGTAGHNQHFIGGIIIAVMALLLLWATFYISSPLVSRSACHRGRSGCGWRRRGLHSRSQSAGLLRRPGAGRDRDPCPDRVRRTAGAARLRIRSRHGAAAVRGRARGLGLLGHVHRRGHRRAGDRTLQGARPAAGDLVDHAVRGAHPSVRTDHRDLFGVHVLDPGIEGDALGRKPHRAARQ